MTDLDNDFEGSNPYNRNKPWQTDNPNPVTDSADTLFVPKRTAPKPQAPKVETTEDDDAGTGAPQGVHDYEKRWKELKTHHDKTVRELREKLGLKESGEGSNIPKNPPKTKEELEQLRQKDPAAFEAMKSIAQLIVSEETSEVKTKLGEIEKRELEFAKQKAKSEVVEAHPDFNDIVNDDEFHLWAEQQDDKIQEWIYNNPTNGRLAIAAINLYKMETGKSKSKGSSSEKAPARKPQDGADSLVSTKTASPNVPSDKKVWSRAEIRKLPMDEYDKYEVEIDKAIREGRITN